MEGHKFISFTAAAMLTLFSTASFASQPTTASTDVDPQLVECAAYYHITSGTIVNMSMSVPQMKNVAQRLVRSAQISRAELEAQAGKAQADVLIDEQVAVQRELLPAPDALAPLMQKYRKTCKAMVSHS